MALSCRRGPPGGGLNLTTNGRLAPRQPGPDNFLQPYGAGRRRVAPEGVAGAACTASFLRMTDWGALYRDHVAALGELAPTLTAEQLRTPVPGTPAWTVHDVLAHVAGGASDAVTGRMDGAPTPEWTSRHVSERAQLPVADLLEELRSHQDRLAESVADSP